MTYYQITNHNKLKVCCSLLMMFVIVFFQEAYAQREASEAETILVKLEVMDQLLKPGDYPAIRGDFPGGGSPEGVALEQAKGNTWTGSVRAPRQSGSFAYEYIIIRADGIVEPEGYEGRRHIFASNGDLPPMNDYLRAGGPLTDKPIEVEITLNLSELHGPGFYIQQAGLSGIYGGLTFDFPDGLRIMESTGEGTWKTTLELPAGTPIDVPLKFAWQVDDVWDYEPLPFYQLHLLLLDTKAANYKLGFRLNNREYRLEPTESTGMEVDNYRKMTELFRGSRNYHYHLAMHLLKQGDPGGADQAYEQFKAYFPELEEGEYKNYYFTDKIESMGREGQSDLALSIVEDKLAVETDSFQQSYYLYLKGWLLREAGRLEAAREALQKSIDMADDEDAYHSQKQYARLGLAMTYRQDPDPVQQQKARGILLEFATTHTNQNLRRDGWEQLANISRNDNNKTLHERALQALQENGTPSQRARSRIRWAEYQLEYGEPDSAGVVITRLKQEVTDERLTDEVQLLRARHLLNQGKNEEARTILQGLDDGKGNTRSSIAIKARHLLRTRTEAEARADTSQTAIEPRGDQ